MAFPLLKKKAVQVAALAATATMALSGCGASGDGQTIRIGIKYDRPGLGYQDGRNYTGFDTDVARYVAHELGYTENQIEWVESPSSNTS